MILEHTDYRSFLKSVLADRQKRNPAYSMRAFANSLELTQPAISQVFSNKKNLSPKTALRVATRLGLAESESEYFCLLVQLESTQDPSLKEALLKKINAINPKREAQDLSVELFRIISDWYHLVIRNMTELEEVPMSPKSIASRLGISPLEAEVALDRLMRLELLERTSDDRYVKTGGDLLVRSSVPNTALRHFNRQMLEKAIEALTSQTPQEKIIGSETMAIAECDLEEARTISEDFFRRMSRLADKSTKKTKVYHLGVQFFNVTPGKAQVARSVEPALPQEQEEKGR